MTTALWNIKSSSRSYCAEFAHSWPHLLLGYPVERHGRIAPPRQRGFPSRETLSRQWEMLLLMLLSCVCDLLLIKTQDWKGFAKRFVVIFCDMFGWKSVSRMHGEGSRCFWSDILQLTYINLYFSDSECFPIPFGSDKRNQRWCLFTLKLPNSDHLYLSHVSDDNQESEYWQRRCWYVVIT